MKKATDCYTDDIIVDETVATADKVTCHLDRFRLTVKQLESLER